MRVKEKLYIGLMSGTSADAVDGVILRFSDESPTVIAHHAKPIDEGLRNKIALLSSPGQDHIDLLGQTDREIGQLFAQTVNELLSHNQINPADITAIGSHGQTIRHRPDNNQPLNRFSLQIGDPNTIAVNTGITTVADFRRKDIALDGEAAPLVPAFHKAILQHPNKNRAVINIGGIANITWLPAGNSHEDVIGFDCGPGNCLLDGWIASHLNQAFDQDGAWAKSGQNQPELLSALLANPYFDRPFPKSTGKELFNMDFLSSVIESTKSTFSPEDVQATLTQFTAETISKGLKLLPQQADEVFLCGGGVFNSYLAHCIESCSPTVAVHSCAEAGIDPMHVEAAAFAWFAHQTINRLPGALSSVTGACRDSVIGGIYFPD